MKTKKRITLVLGTQNPGKVAEWQEQLSGIPVELVLPEGLPDPEETGRSYEANAEIKACYYARHLHHLALAEDSGLDVPALYGFPGIYTARFVDFRITDRSMLRDCLDDVTRHYAPRGLTGAIRRRAANEQILCLMEEVGSTDRTAYYQSAFAIARPLPGSFPARVESVWRGICRGRIASGIRGDQGFGPDPIFIPDGQSEGCIDGRQRTFGEMDAAMIRRLHRHRTDPFVHIRAWLSDPATLDRFGK